MSDAEAQRIEASRDVPDTWRLWGPYLSERAWGTVREDYSADGAAWDYLPHDQARSRAYRWNEDGLGGISDIRQFLCFAPAFWNGRDPILKERLWGLSGQEGNHGEDVKEFYFHADATPSHSYLRFVYLYPFEFPYDEVARENACRTRADREFEIDDTDALADGSGFEIVVEYAKAAIDDIAIRITARHRRPDPQILHVLPTLWFRNTWGWDPQSARPELWAEGERTVAARHAVLGDYRLTADTAWERLFTENETHAERLFGTPSVTPYVKDAFHRAVVDKEPGTVNPQRRGTRAAFHAPVTVPPGGEAVLRLRLRAASAPNETASLFDEFDTLFALRIAEADAFYARLAPPHADAEARSIQRQAYAGLIWSKQFYHYDVARWLDGDPAQPAPPPGRKTGRNAAWRTFGAADILSVPDTWEYPWFAAWDLAFHMVPFAQIDPDFAKHQLLLLCREWYMHPNGQMPAYEWAFGDVNPPVHAWAALRVYKIERKAMGRDRSQPGDLDFLERVFHKLMLNFTWWVNRKDAQGNNVFEGGFLGLDNIGVFDRSARLPLGGYLEQCDGTAWMAMFSLNLLAIALELARFDRSYEDVATKFAEHFCYIAHALNNLSDDGLALWNEDDGFYYDVFHVPSGPGRPDNAYLPIKIRSIVGLIPLFAVEVFDDETLARVPDFTKRLEWFLAHKPEFARDAAHLGSRHQQKRAVFALVGPTRLRRILERILDPEEFLSDHGVRSLSRWHARNPYVLEIDGQESRVDYEPGESRTEVFGGNSNWRGPVWFPINYLLIEALQKYDYAYGAQFQIACPTGTDAEMDLWEVAAELSRRLTGLFRRGADGLRPCDGGRPLPASRPEVFLHEYFHGDTGEGLGAVHQTGWTALVAKLISQSG